MTLNAQIAILLTTLPSLTKGITFFSSKVLGPLLNVLHVGTPTNCWRAYMKHVFNGWSSFVCHTLTPPVHQLNVAYHFGQATKSQVWRLLLGGGPEKGPNFAPFAAALAYSAPHMTRGGTRLSTDL